MNHGKLKDKSNYEAFRIYIYIYIYIKCLQDLGGIMLTDEGWDGNDL